MTEKKTVSVNIWKINEKETNEIRTFIRELDSVSDTDEYSLLEDLEKYPDCEDLVKKLKQYKNNYWSDYLMYFYKDHVKNSIRLIRKIMIWYSSMVLTFCNEESNVLELSEEKMKEFWRQPIKEVAAEEKEYPITLSEVVEYIDEWRNPYVLRRNRRDDLNEVCSEIWDVPVEIMNTDKWNWRHIWTDQDGKQKIILE